MLIVHLLAQAAAAATPEAVAAPQQGVISYPPEFFADFRPQNAMEMINRLPGFAFDGGDQVRGFEGAAGNVLIDGQRPSSKSDNLESVLYRLPASQVERIDLIRGGAPGIDMQGKTVVANVIRKSGGGFRGLAAVSTLYVADDGRTAPAVRLEGSGGSNGRAWEASLLAAQGIDDGAGDGPRIRIDPQDNVLLRSFVESEGVVTGQVTLTGSYETPFVGGRLRVNGRIFLDEFDFHERNYIDFPAPGVEIDQWGQDTDELEVGARDTRNFGDRTTLETVLIQRNQDRHFGETFTAADDTVIFALDRRTGESIGRSVLKRRHSDSLSFEAGAEGAFNWMESETEFFLNGAPQTLPAANVRVEELRGELFGKASWRPSPRWSFEGGLRQEASRISSEGDVALEKTLYFTKPRLSATWAPSESFQVRARIEREVGQLNFNDFVASTDFNTGGGVKAGNPDIEPEQAWVGELAVERRFWKSGAIVLTLRHYELSDVIDRAPIFADDDSVFDAPANIGSGVKQELALNLTLPLERVGLRGAQLKGEATWRHSEVTDPTTGEEREISGLHPVDWEINFTHDVPSLRLTWGVNAFGGWRETYYRFDQIQTLKLKTYVVPFVEWKPRPDISVLAEVRNATERGFRNTQYVYGGPRSTAPLEFVDDRDIQFGRMFYVRLRKTFGG